MKFPKILITLFLICNSHSLFAKKEYIPYVGTESWSSIEISYKVNNWLSFDYENEERFELNYEKKTKILNTFGISTKPFSFIKLDGLFRIRHKNTIPTIEYLIQETYKLSIGNFDFTHRFRIQYKMKEYERILRNKFEIEYKIIKDLNAGISNESFYYLYSGINGKFQEMRHSISLGYELTNYLDISSGFMYETEFNVKKSKDARIYFLDLVLSF